MNVVVTVEARALRRAVGTTAWCVLEELLLDAEAVGTGDVVAATNVRRLAAELGVGKDTAARALTRLALAGLVRRVVAPRGERGALPTSSYVIDLTRVDGVTADARTSTVVLNAKTAPRRSCRSSRGLNDEQPSLFDPPRAS